MSYEHDVCIDIPMDEIFVPVFLSTQMDKGNEGNTPVWILSQETALIDL